MELPEPNGEYGHALSLSPNVSLKTSYTVRVVVTSLNGDIARWLELFAEYPDILGSNPNHSRDFPKRKLTLFTKQGMVT